jgi:SmpA / OmlA family
MRRAIRTSGLLACLGLLGLVALSLTWPRPGVSRANYDRIRYGMTQEAVEAVLGGPPGDYTSNAYDWSWVLNHRGYPTGHSCRTWTADHEAIRIRFDGDGQLVFKDWNAFRGGRLISDGSESVLDKVRRWLGL